MSNSFAASTNLFAGGGSRDSSSSTSTASAATSFAPPLGLRQRHAASTTTTATSSTDENANPNNKNVSISRDNVNSNKSKIPAPPPRISLATSGKFHPRRSAAVANNDSRQQLPSSAALENNKYSTSNEKITNRQASIPSVELEKKNEEEDLSLWIIGYGYRNEAHFRALYQRLERCGTITARRGGLSCFGDDINSDSGDNWVAIRYESALCAQKALCQHGNFVSIGGSTMVMGVMALAESKDVAVQLLGSSTVGGGLVPSSSLSRDGGGVRLIGRSGREGRQVRELRTEEDILLIDYDDRRGIETVDDELKSSIDNFCGKIMSWFFMWGT